MHRLLQGVGTDAGVVRREGAIAEDRIGEQVRRRHRHAHAVVLEGLLEAADDAVAFGGRGVNRHQIVVVEIDAPRAEIAQPLDRNDRVHRWPDELAEGVSTAVADGPEAEGELVRSGGSESVGLHAPMIV